MQQIMSCVSSSLKTLSLLPCLSPIPLQEVEVTLPMKGKKGRAPGVKKPRIAPVAPHSTMTVLPPAVTTPSPLVSSQAVGSTTPAQLPGTQQQVIKVWHNNIMMWYHDNVAVQRVGKILLYFWGVNRLSPFSHHHNDTL